MPIHQLIGSWVVLNRWLLWIIMLLWTHLCTHFCMATCFYFCLGTYWGMEFLSHTVILCWKFWLLSNLFSKGLRHFTITPARYEGTNFCTSSPTLVTFWFYIIVIIIIQYKIYVHYPDCREGYMGTYTSKLIKIYTLVIPQLSFWKNKRLIKIY